MLFVIREFEDSLEPLTMSGNQIPGSVHQASGQEAVGVVQADLAGSALHLRFGPSIPVGPEVLVATVRRLAGATLSPQGVLRVPMPPTASAMGALASALRELETSSGL